MACREEPGCGSGVRIYPHSRMSITFKPHYGPGHTGSAQINSRTSLHYQLHFMEEKTLSLGDRKPTAPHNPSVPTFSSTLILTNILVFKDRQHLFTCPPV